MVPKSAAGDDDADGDADAHDDEDDVNVGRTEEHICSSIEL